MRRYRVTALAIFALLAAGCQSEQIDNTIVGPDEPVSFAGDVQPIFTQSCGGSGCHIGSRANGVRLDSYQNVINSSGSQYRRLIIEPGDPDNSPIVDKIGADPQFGVRMPFGGAPLSGAEIGIIRAWIEEGAEDN